jgi:hypothetical protein
MLRFVRTTAAATSTYKGMAVQKSGEEFKLWEYQAGPLDASDVEIKVRDSTRGTCQQFMPMRGPEWGVCLPGCM